MDFDVVIVGAGLVGASFARALRGSGLSLALVEPRAPEALSSDPGWDSRVYAVSPGSAGFLAHAGAWNELDATRVTSVYGMRVWGDDQVSGIEFSAYDAGVAELAFIVENRLLQNALWNGLARQENLEIFCPAKCVSMAWAEYNVILKLENGAVLETQLIVAADGADSWIRAQAGIEADAKPYQQIGVVANFSTGQSHRNVAWQWFRRDGVLALLPLPGNRISMVWSTDENHAQELLDMPASRLCATLEEACHRVVGALDIITPPAAFPLRLLRVRELVRPRLALIGDAAHNVHPLAGQGVNLGFRDARQLVKILTERGAQNDCGDFRLLRRYERARQEDIVAMQAATDGLHALFSTTLPGAARLRNTGLRLTNRLSPIKAFLMQRAFG